MSPLKRRVYKLDRVGDSVTIIIIYHYYHFYRAFRNTPHPSGPSCRRLQPEHRRTYCCEFSGVARSFSGIKHVFSWTCGSVCVFCVTDRKAVRTTDTKRIANNNDDKPAGQVDAKGRPAVRAGKLAPLQSAYRVWCDSAPGPVLLEESPLILCFNFQSLFFPHFSLCHSTWRPGFAHLVWISRNRILS